jgi:hypothetical protein
MSNMSQMRQISTHMRLIWPGGVKSGLGRSNPAWARGIPAWPSRNRQIPAQPGEWWPADHGPGWSRGRPREEMLGWAG